MNKAALALIIILVVSCVPNRYIKRNPAILSTEKSSSEQITYIGKMDQLDRRKIYTFWIWWFPNGKRATISKDRDEARADRIVYLLEEGKVRSDEEKLTSGLVLYHSASRENFERSLNLFQDVMENGKTEYVRKRASYWYELFKDQ